MALDALHIFGVALFDIRGGHEKLIQVIAHFELELDLATLPLAHALEVTALAALHTPAHGGVGAAPDLEAAPLTMSNIVALAALEDTLSATLRSLVADSVALEAELLVAFEGVMAVLTAQDAV